MGGERSTVAGDVSEPAQNLTAFIEGRDARTADDEDSTLTDCPVLVLIRGLEIIPRKERPR